MKIPEWWLWVPLLGMTSAFRATFAKDPLWALANGLWHGTMLSIIFSLLASLV